MGLGKSLDVTDQYKQNVYNIYFDLSGWDRTAIQVVGPIAAPVFIYGTNDPNALQGVRDGNAQLAINHTPIQATNLATGAAVTSMSAAGLYKVDVNAQFLKLSGGGADVYRMIAFHSKIS
jgi:hypothetical protein